MTSRLAFIAVFAAGLATALPFARGAPDQTRGMAIMSAVVDGNGDLISGVGVKEVERTGTGGYYVRFQRSVEGCTPVASPLANFYDNFVIVDHVPTPTPDSFQVLTGEVLGSAEDTRFSIIVFCGA